jgi:flavin-dependent dehydrogenase
VRALDVTGPFEARPARRTAPGALLAGDAAGYFDPLTGQGVHGALCGAALAARAIAGSLDRPDTEAERLADYEGALDRLFVPVRRVQRLVDLAVRRPALVEPVAAALAARPGLARLLLEVTGDRLPAGALLRPAEWARALAGRETPAASGAGGRATPAPPGARVSRSERRAWDRHAHP